MAKHEKELKALGGDEVISSITDDVPARVKAITGVRNGHICVESI